MASEETPLIQGFVTDIIQSIVPKKEYASRASSLGGVPTSKLDEVIQASYRKRGKGVPATSASQFFSDNANIGGSDAAWQAIQTNQAATATNVQVMSGKSPSELADEFGFDVNTDWKRWTDNDTTFEAMVAEMDARYPRDSTTTPGTTSSTVPKTTAASSTVNVKSGDLMGEKRGPETNDPGTPEQKAQAAKDAADDIIKRANTEEGMSAWQKLAKKWKDTNPRKKKLLGGGVAALAVITTLVGLALDRYLCTDGGEVDFVSIDTKGFDVLGFQLNVVKPTDVEVVWKARKCGPKALPTVKPGSSMRIVDDTAIIFHESGLRKVEEHSDGVNPTEVGDPKKKFSVSTETGDSSDIHYKNKGWATLHTSFQGQFNQVVNDAAEGVTSTLMSTLKAFTPNMNNILNIIVLVVIIGVGVMAIGAIIAGLSSATNGTNSS